MTKSIPITFRDDMPAGEVLGVAMPTSLPSGLYYIKNSFVLVVVRSAQQSVLHYQNISFLTDCEEFEDRPAVASPPMLENKSSLADQGISESLFLKAMAVAAGHVKDLDLR